MIKKYSGYVVSIDDVARSFWIHMRPDNNIGKSFDAELDFNKINEKYLKYLREGALLSWTIDTENKTNNIVIKKPRYWTKEELEKASREVDELRKMIEWE